jgi:hypothetical protein
MVMTPRIHIRSLALITIVGLLIGAAPLATSKTMALSRSLDVRARDVVDHRGPVASEIATLRRAGPPGLDALLLAAQPVLDRGPSDPHWKDVTAAIDAVAGQRDAWVSRLYWYTDWDAAVAAARAQSKPILSLRLLGRLDQDLSCANSRFFRTALYANAGVSFVMREHYVLHWESVRPAPEITINFGDGRVMRRTITGNSIHYVLDADGHVIDALPGLYGASEFLRALEGDAQDARALAHVSGEERDARLRSLHARRIAEAQRAWSRDLSRAGVSIMPIPPQVEAVPSTPAQTAVAATPTAIEALPIAYAKAIVERPLVLALLPGTPGAEPSDTTWSKVATLHVANARLDASSRALMWRKHCGAGAAAFRAPQASDTAFAGLVDRFERAIASDEVRDLYLLRPRVLGWLAEKPTTVAALNERVYSELFLTPGDDPWLGLSPEVYSAIDGEGLIGARDRERASVER